MFKVDTTNRAEKDMETCVSAGYGKKLSEILTTVERDPYHPSQQFERLTGNLRDFCSRKINKGCRFIYTVLPNTEGAKDENGNLYDGLVLVHRSWKHNYKNPK
jgi:Txe/YoeB family toxin of toxin-antitoxin system